MEITRLRKTTSCAVLLVGLCLAVFAWPLSNNYNRAHAQERYQYRSDQIATAMAKRIEDYATVLRGGDALFAASGEVTREDWRADVEHLGVSETFLGIQGISLSKMIQPSELEGYIQQIRAEGFPDYAVCPEGKHDVYISISE